VVQRRRNLGDVPFTTFSIGKSRPIWQPRSRSGGWSHLDGEKDERTRFVAVLEIPPVDSAATAVRLQIVKDFKEKK
jgi:hypothetical protein